MGIKQLSVGRKDIYMVAPENLIEEPGWNVRKQDTEKFKKDLAELVDSIKENGVQEPLRGYVKDEKVVITNGHRRKMAVEKALLDGCPILAVPVMLEERYANEGDLILSMVTRNSSEVGGAGGVPLTALEMAEVFKRLLAFGWDIPTIAKKSGYSQVHVENILSLSTASPEVVEMIKNEEIAATTAIQTIKKEGGVSATEILQHAVKKAHSEGKKKATAKHVKAAPEEQKQEPSYLQWITEAMEILQKVHDTADMSEHLARKVEMLMERSPV